MLAEYQPARISAELCERFGESVALADGQRQWTYQDLHQQVMLYRNLFTHKSLNAGDVVVWYAKNRMEFFAVLLAALEHQLTVLPLNWQESRAVQLRMLRRVQPSLIIAEELFTAEAEYMAQVESIGCHLLNSPITLQETKFPEKASVGVPWYLLFTSGTSGQPKAVLHSWCMARANAENLHHSIELSHTDSTLSLLPHYHTAGINLFALPLLLMGGRVEVRSDLSSNELLTLIGNGAISALLLVPTLWQRLADLPAFQSWVFASSPCRVAASGGAPLALSTFEAWAAKGVIIRNGCGMTESGPTLFLQTEQEARAFPTAIGNPVSGTSVRLCGPDGTDVDDGEAGEIWIKGEAVTTGYWSDSAANKQAYRDGWFRTGDVAQVADHQYWIINRLNDMYICGGENVYPSEVEDVLLQYPGVSSVVVMGAPHRVWGEVGVALVLPEPSVQLQEADLLAWCKQRLARYKVPKRIEFVDEFPTTATGKIRRGLVREWVRS